MGPCITGIQEGSTGHSKEGLQSDKGCVTANPRFSLKCFRAGSLSDKMY